MISQDGKTPNPEDFCTTCRALCNPDTTKILLALERRNEATFAAFLECALRHFAQASRMKSTDSARVLACNASCTPDARFSVCPQSGEAATASAGRGMPWCNACAVVRSHAKGSEEGRSHQDMQHLIVACLLFVDHMNSCRNQEALQMDVSTGVCYTGAVRHISSQSCSRNESI